MGIWYTAGTVSITSGATAVTGVGTLWTGNVKPGDGLVIGSFPPVEILSVGENTALTLAANWPYATQSGQPYRIIPGPQWGDASDHSTQIQALINAFSGQLSGLPANKGNIPVGDASAFQALSVGASGSILRANTGASLGIDWISFQTLLATDQQAPATVASATTTDIGSATSLRVNVTGNATITSLGTSVARLRFVRFTGTPILTHNATSLILPTGANIQVASGDCAVFGSDASGNWTCLGYEPVNGGSVNVALKAIAGLNPAADRVPYYTGTSAAALMPFTSFMRTIADDPDAATVRATIAALGTAGGTLTGPITWGTYTGDLDTLMVSATGITVHRIASGATNTPAGAAVQGSHVLTFPWDVNACRQIYLNLNSNSLWTRRKNSGSIQPWVQFITADDIGTSGAKIPLLNAANTWSAAQTFSNANTYNGADTHNAAEVHNGKETFNDVTTFAKGTRGGALTVADDAVGTITPPNTASGGILRIYVEGMDQSWATVYFRNFGTHLCRVAGTNGTSTAVSTSALSGMTGTDTFITISCNGGVIQIENRSGASRSIIWDMMIDVS